MRLEINNAFSFISYNQLNINNLNKSHDVDSLFDDLEFQLKKIHFICDSKFFKLLSMTYILLNQKFPFFFNFNYK